MSQILPIVRRRVLLSVAADAIIRRKKLSVRPPSAARGTRSRRIGRWGRRAERAQRENRRGRNDMKIGTMELLVILLVAFLVLGPEKTALYTKKLGKGLRALRLYVNSFTEDLTESVTEPLQDLKQPLDDLQKPLKDLQKPLEESVQAVRKPMDELETSLRLSDARLKAPVKDKLAQKTAETGAPTPAAESADELEEAISVSPEAVPAGETEQE